MALGKTWPRPSPSRGLWCSPPQGGSFPVISLEFNLFLWTNESRLSKPYLSTLFPPFFFFCLCLGPLEIWAWGKEKQIRSTFPKNAWALTLSEPLQRHEASVSISHRPLFPELFYSKVQWRIYSHLVISSIVIQLLNRNFTASCVGWAYLIDQNC